MEIKWLGWSCFRIKTSGKTIYFDPVVEDSEPADLVLISHSHSDHTDLGTLSRIRKPSTTVFTSAQNSPAVKGTGLIPGEKHVVGPVTVKTCQAYNLVHMRSPGNPFHPKGFGLGWIVESEGKRLYHTGDTDLIPEMEKLGHIDVMLVPISGVYVMDVDEAVKAVKLIRPTTVIPMHYGVIDIPGENPTHYDLQADPNAFAEKLKGIAEVVILKPGESINI